MLPCRDAQSIVSVFAICRARLLLPQLLSDAERAAAPGTPASHPPLTGSGAARLGTRFPPEEKEGENGLKHDLDNAKWHLTGCHPMLPCDKSELINRTRGRPGPPMDLGPTQHPQLGSSTLRRRAVALLRSAGSIQDKPALNNTQLERRQRAGSITPQALASPGTPAPAEC